MLYRTFRFIIELIALGLFMIGASSLWLVLAVMIHG